MVCLLRRRRAPTIFRPAAVPRTRRAAELMLSYGWRDRKLPRSEFSFRREEPRPVPPTPLDCGRRVLIFASAMCLGALSAGERRARPSLLLAAAGRLAPSARLHPKLTARCNVRRWLSRRGE